MTGYGFAEIKKHDMRVTVEISSVNKKGLDLMVSLPKNLLSLEIGLRQLAQKEVGRGRVSMNVAVSKTGAPSSLPINDKVLEHHYHALKRIAKRLGISQDISMSLLLNLPGVMNNDRSDEASEELKKMVEETTQHALEQLLKSRAREGKFLCAKLIKQFKSMEKVVKKVERIAPYIIQRHRQNLLKRTEDAGVMVDAERLSKEVALFADRSDITEELTRLKAHLKEAERLLDGHEPVGRNLDFLLQEINREVNTIGSKANGLEISQHVIYLKTELEKVREQVQNLE